MNTAKALKTLRKMGELISKDQRDNYSIKDLKTGSFLKIEKELFTVMGIFTYTEGGDSWYELELFSINTGKTTYIEYEEDDSIEMYITTSTHNIRELPTSIDQIEEISEHETGSLQFQGKTFYYEDDYEAKFFRTVDKKESVCIYEFSNENEDVFLTIEEWGNKKDGYEYQVFISETLEKIEVISI